MGEIPDHMKRINQKGGLAFPFVSQGGFHEHQEWWYGMTLRDWFAGQAAMGMATAAGWQGAPWNKIAEDSYRLADALLLARETQQFAEEEDPF